MAAVTILVILAGLTALRIPIAVAMIASGLIGAAVTTDVPVWPLFRTVASDTVSGGIVLPTLFSLFLLTGLARASVGSRHIFDGLRSSGQPSSGGGALLAILAFGLGSAMGDSMDRRGAVSVHDRLTTAGYSEASIMGILLGAVSFRYIGPVSAVIVVGGYLAEQSIGKLILAMIVPAVLLFILLLATAGIADLRRRKPEQPDLTASRVALKAPIGPAVVGIVVSLVMVLIVTWFLASGLLTPAETFAVAAFLMLVVALIICLIGLALWTDLFEAFVFAAAKTAEIALILIGAVVIIQVMNLSGFANAVAEAPLAAPALLIATLAVIILLAAIFGAIPAMCLGIAVAYPLSAKTGGDGLWLVCVVVGAAALGQTIPFIGRTNRFLAQCFPTVTAGALTRGALPYALILLLWLALIYLVPDLVIALPTVVMS